MDKLDGDDETTGIVCSQNAVALGNLGTIVLPAGLVLVVQDGLGLIEGIRRRDRRRQDFSPEEFGGDCLDHLVSILDVMNCSSDVSNLMHLLAVVNLAALKDIRARCGDDEKQAGRTQ